MEKKLTVIFLFFTFFFFLLAIDNCYAKERRDDIIKIINRYEELNDSYQKSVEKDNLEKQQIAREKVEHYFEEHFDPILSEIEKLVCENNDQELLNVFLQLLIKTPNSANESPDWTLGNIYLNCPDLVLNKIAEFKNNLTLLNALDFGFQNVTYGKEDQINNFGRLQKNIKELIKTKSPTN